MKGLELKVPPALLTMAVTGLMWLISWLSPSLMWPIPARRWTVLALIGMGLVFVIGGLWSFALAGTTVDPTRPDKAAKVVSSGVYRISRNPMYLGFLMFLAAVAAWLSHPVSLLCLPGFVFYMNRYQIVPEERALVARFGEAFEKYGRRVRRWI